MNELIIDYGQQKKFLGFFSERYMPLDQMPRELWPLSVLEKLEAISLPKAKRGMVQAIADCIEIGAGLGPEELEELDRQLVAHNIATFSEMWGSQKKIIQKVLAKDTIEDRTTFYLLTNFVNLNTVSKQEIVRANHLLHEYERKNFPN